MARSPAVAPWTPASSAAGCHTQSRVRELVADRIVSHRERYAAAVLDWAVNGARSRFALPPDEVVAHFELAQHLWTEGSRDAALSHFREAHRLQPENWTYRRQAWSLVSVENNPGPRARLQQWPTAEHADAWPFESDFLRDLEKLPRGAYYPESVPE
jgi:hypothetical protein